MKKISALVSSNEIGLIQLRDKHGTKTDILKFATKLVKCLALTKTLLIINDYADVALAALADGVHLGQEDFSIREARKVIGKDRIVGVTCHNLSEALKAQNEGADYIGIGPLYTTITKPGCPGIGLKAAAALKAKIKIPYFAIGNIGEGNLGKITAAGIRRIAVCRSILDAGDPQQAAKRLHRLLGKVN